MNGLIRQHLSKGVSMERLTPAGCDRIADKRNRRPGTRYDWYKSQGTLCDPSLISALQG